MLNFLCDKTKFLQSMAPKNKKIYKKLQSIARKILLFLLA
jgi:hypothetical protein